VKTKTKQDLPKRLRRDLEVHPFAVSLEELVAKITPENQHKLLSWGSVRGKEVEGP
jgi:hypothetical protein